MLRRLSVLTLLSLSMTNAIAVEWTSIIKDVDHEVLVDIDSYNVSDGFPYLIAKTIYQKPQTFILPSEETQYLVSIAKLQFNCKKPMYRTRSIQLLDNKQKLIDTIKISSQFKKLEMNTDAFSIGQLTCQVHQMLGV